MEHPEFLYYAAMFLIALPIAVLAKSPASTLVFLAWAINKTAYELGMPEPQMQLIIYITALTIGMRVVRTNACLFSAIFFFPLALACVCELAGWLTPLSTWWTIYWLAMIQALSLPFCVDWHRAAIRWRNFLHQDGGSGMLCVQHV